MATQKRITQTGAFLVSRQLLKRVDAMAARRGITRPTYCKEAMVRLLVSHALGRVGTPPQIIERKSTDRINGLVLHQRIYENFRSYCGECKRSHNDTMEFALEMAVNEDEQKAAFLSQRIRDGKARASANKVHRAQAAAGTGSVDLDTEADELDDEFFADDDDAPQTTADDPPASAEVPFADAAGQTAEDVPA